MIVGKSLDGSIITLAADSGAEVSKCTADRYDHEFEQQRDPDITKMAEFVGGTFELVPLHQLLCQHCGAAVPLEPDVAAKLDPGVRNFVVWLRTRGWWTTDSGDGQAKGEDGLEFPHVFIRVSPKHMVDLSEHLLEDLRYSILRCTAVESEFAMRDGAVEVKYSPRDGYAILMVTDSDRRFMHLWPEDAR